MYKWIKIEGTDYYECSNCHHKSVFPTFHCLNCFGKMEFAKLNDETKV